MKVYTKTGDGGETSLIGKRISKDAEILDVLGTLDELNSAIGLVNATLFNDKKASKKLELEISRLKQLQSNIFTTSSIIAGAKNDIRFETLTNELETNIDEWTETLRPLTNFILPGGSQPSANIHFARTICRKAERVFVGYTNVSESRPDNYKEIRKYFNRLSDWLFTLARVVNSKLKIEDEIWVKDPDELKLI